jgi:hypothetical protein
VIAVTLGIHRLCAVIVSAGDTMAVTVDTPLGTVPAVVVTAVPVIDAAPATLSAVMVLIAPVEAVEAVLGVVRDLAVVILGGLTRAAVATLGTVIV